MIEYPTKKKNYIKKRTKDNNSNRGMRLEEDINRSNEYYRSHDIAIIHKKPTPIQIVHVDYPSRNKAKITEAYFKQPSTTDYQGVYKGYSLDFEAKETRNKTIFPISLIHDHQLQHLNDVIRHGGIAFLIIRFTTVGETFLIFAKDVLEYIKQERIRSLSLDWIREHGYPIDYNYLVPCDFIKIIDKFFIRSDL